LGDYRWHAAATNPPLRAGAYPGELLHIDTPWLGRIDGVRQRIHDDPARAAGCADAGQEEIDAAIAVKAEYKYLHDKPYEDKKKVRVAGPFAVESLSPQRSRTGPSRWPTGG
jgi:hypothetical protein